jgi:hypothetical protein
VKVHKVHKDDWASGAAATHLVVFGESSKPEMDRIDFALVVESEHEIPLQYASCRELSADSLFLQYGGSFPGTKGTISSLRCFEELLTWARDAGYKRISFLVENTNLAMLKLALTTGFLITGVRNHKGAILLEHVKEFLALEVPSGS